MKRMDLTSPEGAKVTLQKVLSEGECEFWDRFMSRIRTQPLLLFFLVLGVSLVLFGRSGLLRRPSLEALARLCFVALWYACVMHA